MSFLEIQAISDVKVCRICLAVDVKMHNLLSDPLKTSFESIVGKSVMCTVQLPMFLCYECAALVRKFSLFKERCLKAQAIFSGLLQNGVQLSLQVIQNIDRQQLLLNSPYISTNVETIEYIPLNDNCIKILTNENYEIKEELLNCILETKSHDDSQIINLDDILLEAAHSGHDDAFQDAANSSDDELLTIKVEKKIQEPTENTGQEYLNILPDDFVQDLIKLEPKPLPETASICKNQEDQSKKSEAIDDINKDKLLEANLKPPKSSAKFPRTSAKSRRTGARSPRTSAKSPRTSAKFKRSSAKSPRNSADPLTTGEVSPSSKVESLTTSKKPQTGKTKSRTTSSKSQTKSYSVIKGDDDTADLVEYEVITLTLSQQFEEVEKRKESENYLSLPFKCEFCYRGFADTNTYNNHAKKHVPTAGDFTCKICNLWFRSKRSLQKHTTDHRTKYACKGCSYVCRNISTARLHQKWHKGVLYKCEICGKLSGRQNSHFTHVRNNHPTQYICDICGYSFASEQGLSQHKALMHRDTVETNAKSEQESDHSGPYCEECDMKFVSLEAYNRHMVTSTKHSAADFIGGCQTCGARFSSKEELRVHRKEQHKAEPSQLVTLKKYTYTKKITSWPAKCEHCSEEIQNARDNWVHFRRVHPDIPYPCRKDFVCDICGKRYKSNALLTYHKRTHSSERPFSCKTCGKSFYNRSNLWTHEQTHSDACLYSCKLCSKMFKFRANLTRHYRSHDGVRPYQCDICGKTFSQSNSRNIHIRTVHFKEPPPYMSKARLEKKRQSKKLSNKE